MFLFKDIGPIMKRARKKNKLTIRDVSEITGLNADTISDLENQRTNMKIFTLLDHLVHLYKLDRYENPELALTTFQIFEDLSDEAIAEIVAVVKKDRIRQDAKAFAAQDVID